MTPLKSRYTQPSPSSACSRLVPALLREYGARIHTSLMDYLALRTTPSRLEVLMAEYPSRGGKKMRPTLLLATSRAFGAPFEEALAAAVSLELQHVASVVHDDIQDASEERRGGPALHREYGIPLALCAGDGLLLRSLRPLLSHLDGLGPRLTLRIIEEAHRTAREAAEGQALELGWRRDNLTDLGEDDYLRMVLKKTCWLTTINPLRIGALIGSRDTVELDALTRLGFFLGVAFQIQDDVLNLIGDRQQYGKELSGDLWEGKRTLMLIRLFNRTTVRESRRLTAILRRPRDQRTPDDVCWMKERIEAYGCIDYAQKIAWAMAGAARFEFRRAFAHLPDSRDKRFVEELLTWVVERRR